MSYVKDDSQMQLFRSSLWGVLRGISVHTIIYPLEVVKIRQQCSHTSTSSVRVALHILKAEGMGAFYKGVFPQLLKTSLKQFWCWPMITGIPHFLQRYPLGGLQRNAITGLSIATIDAAITTPFERAKILSAYTGKVAFSLRSIYQDGWRGFTTHWLKLSVNWMTFLTAQKYLRDRASNQSGQQLSLLQLSKIGAQVALIVSFCSAPFDFANTLKHTYNTNMKDLLSRNGIFKLYRGWPLNALSLIIHNIASVIVIDKLSK